MVVVGHTGCGGVKAAQEAALAIINGAGDGSTGGSGGNTGGEGGDEDCDEDDDKPGKGHGHGKDKEHKKGGHHERNHPDYWKRAGPASPDTPLNQFLKPLINLRVHELPANASIDELTVANVKRGVENIARSPVSTGCLTVSCPLC